MQSHRFIYLYCNINQIIIIMTPKKLIGLFFIALMATTAVQAQSAPAVDSSKCATIYLYRTKGTLTKMVTYMVSINGKDVWQTKENEKVSVIHCKPGEVEVLGYAASKSWARFDVEAGKTYYVRCNLTSGFYTYSPVLKLMDEKTGKRQCDELTTVGKLE
jgi:hypothetical protein